MTEKEEKTEKKEEPKVEAQERIVEVLYGGVGGWAISPSEGEQINLGPGDKFEFDITRQDHLNHVIQIVKQINEPKVNVCHYLVKTDTADPNKKRYRFAITKGEGNIPATLRKMKYRRNNAFTNEEREAILSVCPNYQFTKPKTLYELRR